MKQITLSLMVALCVLFTTPMAEAGAVGAVSGTIANLIAGRNDWYGVRFFLNITGDTTGNACDSTFVYTEADDPLNGHKEKVAVFLAAFMAGKNVTFTVEPGRNNFCKIIEGQVF